MRRLEQITIEEMTTTMTLAEYALYGGIFAMGALTALYFILRK